MVIPTWASHLLRVALFIGQKRGDVEHDLYAAPVGVDRVQSCQIMHGV